MVPVRGRGLLSNVALQQLAHLPLFDETGSLAIPKFASSWPLTNNSPVNKIKENSGTPFRTNLSLGVQSSRSFPQRGIDIIHRVTDNLNFTRNFKNKKKCSLTISNYIPLYQRVLSLSYLSPLHVGFHSIAAGDSNEEEKKVSILFPRDSSTWNPQTTEVLLSFLNWIREFSDLI